MLLPGIVGGCGLSPICSTEIVQVARDIGTDRYATTESRNCGATVDYATVVRIGRAGERQADAQEVFVANSDHGRAAEGGRGTIWTDVAWTSRGVLLIRYAAGARVFRRRAEAFGASVQFRTGERITSRPVP